jgi:hypothetical protein
LAPHIAGQARPDHSASGSVVPRAGRGDGGGDDPGAGQADRPVATRDPARLRHHRMGCDRGPPGIRPGDPARARHAQHRAASADRRRRRVFAMELPDEFAGAQICRRPVFRVLDHPQGVGGNPGRRGAAGPRLCRCRGAAGYLESGVRHALGDLRVSDPAAGRCGSSPSPAQSRSENIWRRWPASI